LDPLIKSQLLYQLSYAPTETPRKIAGRGRVAKGRRAVQGTGLFGRTQHRDCEGKAARIAGIDNAKAARQRPAAGDAFRFSGALHATLRRARETITARQSRSNPRCSRQCMAMWWPRIERTRKSSRCFWSSLRLW
jgi:hypothetical protein